MVWKMVIDSDTGEETRNAGHMPARHSILKQLFLYKTEAGTLLGWASPRRQHKFRMPPGRTAVLYSNGLLTNRVRGLDAGLDELVRVAASAPDELLSAPERLLPYLLDHMLAGREQDDDVTMLILRRER